MPETGNTCCFARSFCQYLR